MAMRWRFGLILAVLVLFGCSRDVKNLPVAASGDTSVGPELEVVVDDLRSSLLEADRRFARDVAQRRLEAWVDAFAADGSMLPATGPAVTGHDAIREVMAPAFADPAFELTWEPQSAGAAQSGELGYTFGSFESHLNGKRDAVGKYVTIWRRDEDGRWQVLVDIGNREPVAR